MTTAADMPHVKLGAHPSLQDPRTLKLTNYTTTDRPAGPARADWMRQIHSWPLYSNDKVGDCVAVSCAHLMQGWTRYASLQVVLPQQDVLDAYAAVSGWNPVTGENDLGCRPKDMLGHWRHNGIAGRKIVAYVAVNPNDRDEVRYATHLFGGLLVGLDLPLSAGTQFRQRKVWFPGHGDAGVPGSWGGHAVRTGKFDGRYVTCSTWGHPQRMSWSFFDTYAFECWAVVSSDWIAANGQSPTGLRLDDLLADLRRITAK